MSEKLSIKSIAKEMGVSVTTVSFILNGKGPQMRISQSLTEQVKDFVRKKGYKQNQIAKSLATGKTMTIGLLVENISDVFFSEIAYYIGKLALKHGYKVIYGSTENDPEVTRGLLTFFQSRMVDGLIIAPPPGLQTEITELVEQNYPLVLFDRYYPELECNYVISDNYESTSRAIRYLISQGKKNIAFITTLSDQQQMLDRLNAYSDSINASGLDSMIKRVTYADEQDYLEVELKDFFSSNPQLDAVFFATHYLTLAGLKIIKDLDLKVPQQLAIASFDDLPVFDVVQQPISAIRQPVKQMCLHLMQTLLGLMNKKNDEQQAIKTLKVPSEFIIREGVDSYSAGVIR